MRDEKEERKKQARVKQTNKAKQHSTPKAVTFPRKNELPQVGLEPTTLYTLDRALYHVQYASKCFSHKRTVQRGGAPVPVQPLCVHGAFSSRLL